MFVEATIFDKRHCDLPGGLEILYQGVGEDSGWAVVEGDAGHGDGYYLVDKPGPSVKLLDVSGLPADRRLFTEPVTLVSTPQWPVNQYADANWFATGDPAGAFDIVRSKIYGWFPREWTFMALDPSAYGTTDPGDRAPVLFGDYWLRGQTPQGECRNEYDPQVNPPQFDITQLWGTVYKHSGKGDAPAGEYTNVYAAEDVKHVGYWNESEGKYVLREDPERVWLFNPVILRASPPDTIPTPAQLVAQGWNFAGADWVNPNPTDWRYWYAIRCAILERESVLPGSTLQRPIGSLIPNERVLAGISPWCPIHVEQVRALRDAIRALMPYFCDFEKVLHLIANGQSPDVSKTLPDYLEPLLSEGWCAGDSLDGVRAGRFLAVAYETLQKMVVCVPPKAQVESEHSPQGGGFATEGQGEFFSDAFNDAHTDYDNNAGIFPKAYYGDWWFSRLTPDFFWVLVTTSIGVYSEEVDEIPVGPDQYDYELSWTANVSTESHGLLDLSFPNTSILDGQPLAKPRMLWARLSKVYDDDGKAIGDAFRNGYITGISYHSSFATQGGSCGVADLPVNLSEEFPPMPSRPIPAEEYNVPGYSLVGNVTNTWFYCYWGESFRFGGPMPDVVVPEPDPEPEPEP